MIIYNNNNTHISYKLTAIKTEQFAILSSDYSSKKEVTFTTSLQVKSDFLKRLLGMFITVEFTQQKKIILKLQVSCHFKIDSLQWDSFTDKLVSELIVPKEVVIQLGEITLNITKGILHSKTESTPFYNLAIPIMNVSEMINDDARFRINPNS